MLHFLEDLPREIRDKIYAYVLASPSGCITLARGKYKQKHSYRIQPHYPTSGTTHCHPDNAIGLQLLKTCKQIYEESRDILWQLNTYGIDTSWDLADFSMCPPLLVGQSIRSLEFGIHYPTGSEFAKGLKVQRMEKIFERFGEWSEHGSLAAVRLHLVQDFDKVMLLGRISPINSSIVRSHRFFLAALTTARTVSLRNVHRDLALKSSWPRLTAEQRMLWTKVQNAKEDNPHWVFTPNRFLRDVHSAWGGELWLDGELCARNGRTIRKPFWLLSPQVKVQPEIPRPLN
ncbi:hypothetical protein BP5796_02412 [Coleophoma crateriformis]|uniref:DUF7730 domain-containing protein n=1 Tax=Coleophoma crateriformis TaxID=565419 RepID=A0A3D8SY38_9HELO|nr:hypothetical protein BP5796_02412 [Coleophoma crateriformis]